MIDDVHALVVARRRAMRKRRGLATERFRFGNRIALLVEFFQDGEREARASVDSLARS
jgi:hypothetical protein